MNLVILLLALLNAAFVGADVAANTIDGWTLFQAFVAGGLSVQFMYHTIIGD